MPGVTKCEMLETGALQAAAAAARHMPLVCSLLSIQRRLKYYWDIVNDQTINTNTRKEQKCLKSSTKHS
jgi:hypothetical protein